MQPDKSPLSKLVDRSGDEVWIVQRYLAHYRTPVFEELNRRLLEHGLTLKVIFDLNLLEGPADPSQPYCDPFVRLHEFRVFGTSVWHWSRLLGGLRKRRPAAVIVEGMPRILTNLLIPAFTRSCGGRSLVWVKGHVSPGTSSGALSRLLRRSNSLRRIFLLLFDGVICYGREGLRELLRIGVPAERITVAQNTIDTGRIFAGLERRDRNAADLKSEYGIGGRRLVVCCGTMYPKKRHLDLLEAWPAIRSENPDAVLAFVGGGEMYQAVKEHVARSEDNTIMVIGPVAEGEDYRWIGAADVSVMCGGLGLAIQQSLAFGRPMVVADEPGVDGEIIQHEVTGWRYRKGDVRELSRTVNAVLADPVNSADVARQGQELMRKDVNITRMVDGFMEALQKVGVINPD